MRTFFECRACDSKCKLRIKDFEGDYPDVCVFANASIRAVWKKVTKSGANNKNS